MFTSTKLIILTTAVLSSALLVFSQAQNSANYSDQALKCISDYKSCALGDGAACTDCKAACDNQPGLREALPAVCTLLRDYCIFKEEVGDSTSCVDAQCVTFNQNCRAEGLESPSCGYCASNCRTCPDLYAQCKPDAPVPTPVAGTCNIAACTYYSRLCTQSFLGSSCDNCNVACEGLCDDEAQKCKDARALNVNNGV